MFPLFCTSECIKRAQIYLPECQVVRLFKYLCFGHVSFVSKVPETDFGFRALFAQVFEGLNTCARNLCCGFV